MSNVRDRIELGFAAWGHMAYRRAWWVIALALVVTGTAASQLPKFRFDTTIEGFFHDFVVTDNYIIFPI